MHLTYYIFNSPLPSRVVQRKGLFAVLTVLQEFRITIRDDAITYLTACANFVQFLIDV